MMRKLKGFTLVESMITVAVIGILASIAAPSFVTSIDRTKVKQSADFLTQIVMYSRSEAINKNKNIYLTLPNNTICISSTQKNVAGHTCDVRNDPATSGVVLTLTDTDNNGEIVFDGTFGFPDTTANIAVSPYSGNTKVSVKTISISILGFAIIS